MRMLVGGFGMNHATPGTVVRRGGRPPLPGTRLCAPV
jgi:hypothetical protein